MVWFTYICLIYIYIYYIFVFLCREIYHSHGCYVWEWNQLDNRQVLHSPWLASATSWWYCLTIVKGNASIKAFWTWENSKDRSTWNTWNIHSKWSVWVSLCMFLGFASWMLGKSKPKILSQTVMKNGGESPTKLNKQKELLTINPYKKLSFQKDHSIKDPLVPSLSEPRKNRPTFLYSACLIRIQPYILNTT